jgi:hypothetical protein
MVEDTLEEGHVLSHGDSMAGWDTEEEKEEENAMRVLEYADFEALVMKRVHNVCESMNCTAEEVFRELPAVKYEIEKLTQYSGIADAAAKKKARNGQVDSNRVDWSKDVPSADQEVECPICLCPPDPEDPLDAAIPPFLCGHFHFCHPCLLKTLVDRMSGPSGKSKLALGYACPHGECTEVIPNEVVLRLLETESATIEKHRNLFTQKFARWLPNMKVCPRDCNRVIRNTRQEPSECTCGSVFCGFCGLENHGCIPCGWLQEWIEKELRDDETDAWLKAHTKACPHCSVRIEKLDGCNHMNCQSCDSHFCWFCNLKCWSPGVGGDHGDYYTCGMQAVGTKQEEEENHVAMENAKEKRRNYSEHYELYLKMRMREKQCEERAIAVVAALRKDGEYDPYVLKLVKMAFGSMIGSLKFQKWALAARFHVTDSTDCMKFMQDSVPRDLRGVRSL